MLLLPFKVKKIYMNMLVTIM